MANRRRWRRRTPASSRRPACTGTDRTRGRRGTNRAASTRLRKLALEGTFEDLVALLVSRDDLSANPSAIDGGDASLETQAVPEADRFREPHPAALEGAGIAEEIHRRFHAPGHGAHPLKNRAAETHLPRHRVVDVDGIEVPGGGGVVDGPVRIALALVHERVVRLDRPGHETPSFSRGWRREDRADPRPAPRACAGNSRARTPPACPGTTTAVGTESRFHRAG